MNHYQRRKAAGICVHCGGPRGSATAAICADCVRRSSERQRVCIDRYKREVINLLGGICSCISSSCWHADSCAVTDARCLSVHHIDGGGNDHRKDKSGQRVSQIVMWRRYRDAIKDNSYRLQLLCFNCHRVIHTTEEA